MEAVELGILNIARNQLDWICGFEVVTETATSSGALSYRQLQDG